MVSLLISVLFSGYVVTRTQLPDWFIWIYWIDPISWGLRSLAVSQFRHEEFDRCVVTEGGTNYCTKYAMDMGEYYLSFYDLQSERSWIVYGVIFNFVTSSCSSHTVHWKRIETLTNLTVPKKTTTTEYVEWRHPKPFEKASWNVLGRS
ncbi:unnamed protein product [Phytophthora fragariaefolia]|uniref:Unnamed protein product n=1 Tax=Phytophthora fragariaefolia TaxID=1490495 RepID=A0A9W6XX53_9STRA|nr:unnamed protein product [Phytophthora fragariaefolia]